MMSASAVSDKLRRVREQPFAMSRPGAGHDAKVLGCVGLVVHQYSCIFHDVWLIDAIPSVRLFVGHDVQGRFTSLNL